MRLSAKTAIGSLLLLVALGSPAPSQAKGLEISSKPIPVFSPAEPTRSIFGKLEFLGGLELSARNENFGGISGLRLDETGRKLFAVTDQGHFLTADIGRQPAGEIASFTKATISRLRDRNGKKISGKKNGDAEALEIHDGEFYVGFERNHRIEIFKRQDDRLFADKKEKPISLTKFGFPRNKGPEAVAISHETGRMVLFAEYAPDDENNHKGFVFKGGKLQPVSVTLTVGYSLTDAAFLPDGDLLILERFYTPITGPAMRIRRFNADNITAGALLEGEIIMEANSSMELDNMEGLAVSKLPDASTRISLISDDNFSSSAKNGFARI